MSEASDETKAQHGTIDAGAAMGTADKTTDETPSVAEADRVGYDELVNRAADLVEAGTTALDEMAPKEYHDQDVQTFRADVREEMDGHTPDEDVETVASVDWGALWEEFGMDTPDSIGSYWMSETKLRTAVLCSEQGISGDADGRITDAVDAGALAEVRTDNGTLRGYVYIGGEQ